MNAAAAWQKTTGSKVVTVAVLSTGILPAQPDIAGSPNLLPGYSFVTIDGEKRKPDATDPGQDCSDTVKAIYEGTHTAGTIGAARTNNGLAIAALNWNVSVLPVRVVTKCQVRLDDLAQAILWAAGSAAEGVPVNPHPAHIIMLDVGFDGACTREQFGMLIDAIQAARAKGAVIVVPAGDAAGDVKASSPGSCPGVISVAASGGKGQIASYSNYGGVTVMAPGGDPSTTDQSGQPAYIWSVGPVASDNPQGLSGMRRHEYRGGACFWRSCISLGAASGVARQDGYDRAKPALLRGSGECNHLPEGMRRRAARRGKACRRWRCLYGGRSRIAGAVWRSARLFRWRGAGRGAGSPAGWRMAPS